MKIRIHGVSDPGKPGAKNDDVWLTDPETRMSVVCDGVSGQSGGAEAARIAVGALRDSLRASKARLDALSASKTPESRDETRTILQSAIQRANEAVFQAAAKNHALAGMASTMEVVVLSMGHAVIGHLGDSRTFVVRGGEAHLLTEDHRVGTEMVKQGAWSPEIAAASPFSRTLTRAIGLTPYARADFIEVEIAAGDSLIVCSDGIGETIPEKELSGIIGAAQGSPEAACTKLVKTALAKQAKDNLTAIVISVDPTGASPTASAPQNQAPVAAANPAEQTDILKRFNLVGKVPLFRYAGFPDISRLLSIARARTFKAGESIFKEGDQADSMFVVIQGEVLVSKNGAELSRRKAGDLIGEMGLIEGAPRSADVSAATPVSAVFWGRQDVIGLFKKEPTLAIKILWAMNEELSRRLRIASQELADAKTGGGEIPPLPEPDGYPLR